MQNINHHRKHDGGGGGGGGGVCCCRCICFCCCFLSLLISILIIIPIFLFRPKIPIYKIQSVKVKALKFSPDSLTSDFLVAVRAENPNKNIEFIHGSGGWVGIEYAGVNICGGELPAFQHGVQSTTSFEVELKGKSALGPDFVEVFLEQQYRRRVPVKLMLKVPMGVVVGKMRVREMNVFVNVSLVLDGLSPGIAAGKGIVSTKTVFRIQIL